MMHILLLKLGIVGIVLEISGIFVLSFNGREFLVHLNC